MFVNTFAYHTAFEFNIIWIFIFETFIMSLFKIIIVSRDNIRLKKKAHE